MSGSFAADMCRDARRALTPQIRLASKRLSDVLGEVNHHQASDGSAMSLPQTLNRLIGMCCGKAFKGLLE
jgi:hypothetical protein